MGEYSDNEIRCCKKITCKIAGDYLGISPMAVSIGMRNDLLPIGFSIKNEDRFSKSWSYNIIDERLIAYKHGKITNIQVQNIEKKYNEEVERTIALENAALDYEVACRIRAYVKAVFTSYGQDRLDEETVTWVDWATKKADWFDPTVVREDEFFGERDHEKSLEEKALKKVGQYW